MHNKADHDGVNTEECTLISCLLHDRDRDLNWSDYPQCPGSRTRKPAAAMTHISIACLQTHSQTFACA